MKNLRKSLVVGVMVLTVLATSGIFNISAVKAAASAGDLIKMDGNAAVYYLGADGKRYVFPNSTTYFSWYADFSGVVTIPATELQSYLLGGNVVMRPGTKLVKITTDPKVYAVEPNGVLRGIQSEAQAASLWGSNWNTKIVDVADSYFTNYTIGTALPLGSIPAGSLVKNANATAIYYFDGTNYRSVASEAALMANRFDMANVLTISNTIIATGSAITGVEAALVKTSQGGSTGPINVITGSGLMVSLNSNTPSAATVPVKAVNVPFTIVNLTAANDGPVTVNTLVVSRTGIGAASDLNNVYLYDGATRLTTGRTVNSSTNKVTFNNLNLTIAAGMTKSITISADTNTGTQTGTDALGIMSASDITSTGANVSGSFPVYGNMMSIANVSVGSVTVNNGSTITNPKVGEMQAKVAEFKLTAGSIEDLSVKGITLYQAGSISNSNITNFTLKQAGTTVATAAAISGNSVVFNFATPYSIDKGIVKTFEVYADINSGARSGDTIRLYVDNDSDVYAVGKTYGYGVAVTRTAYDGSAGDATDSSLSTIEAGQLTMSFQGPSVTDYSVQSTGVELFRMNVTSQNNIEVRKTIVNLTAGGTITAASGLVNTTSGSVANYTNIKLVDATTNQIIAGPKDVNTASSDTTQDITYTDTWTMNAGQTKTLKVVADIANFTPATDETIKATFVAFGASDIKNLDNNTFVAVANIVPNTSIVGNTHTVKSASAVLSLAGTPSAQSYINGSANVSMTGINIKAGTGKDINVTSVKVTATGADSCSTVGNCILSVKLYDGATQVGQTKALSSGTATFSGLNVLVAKGTTKTLTVKADLNNLSTVGGSTTLSIGVAAPADVVAQDVDGNSVTLTGGAATGPVMIVLGAGTATVVKAGDENNVTDSRLVAAGSDDITVAKFRFGAQNEDLQLTKLRIRARGTAAGDGAIREVASISLWDGATKIADGITPSATSDGTITWAVADFSNITNFIVPKDSSKDLTVKASFNTISAGARAGQNLSFSIDPTNSALSTALSGGNYQLRGINGSNTTVSTLTTTATGNTLYIYKTIPTIAPISLPSTVLAGGEQTISKFSITADAKGTVDWTQITFTVTPSAGVTVASLRLTDESGNTVSNVTCTDGTGVCVSTTDQQVGAGTTKTYALKGTITGAVAGSTVATTIASDAAGLDGTNGALVAAKNFVWSDESASPHSIDLGAGTSSTDYHDGFKVKTLPSDSQALSK